MDVVHQFEITLILLLQNLGSGLAEFFRLVSMLGNEEFYMLVMPLLYWSVDTALGMRMAVMLLLSNGINCVFKVAFHSPRPYWLDTQVKGYVSETSFGIPSGHAQNAAGLWGLLAASRRLAWEKVVLVGIIFLIGLSRIYLGVHFISDVLVGWLIGGVLLFLFIKLERPLVAWLKTRSLGQMMALAVTTSLVLMLIQILPIAAMGAWQTPSTWAQNALVSQPDGPIDPLNLDGVFTVSGTWLGMLIGVAWLYHRQGGFNASGTPGQRLLRFAVGVAGILVLWFGLGQVFPRSADLVSFVLRFFRYTLVGLWVSAAAPLLFERMGLAHTPEKKIPSFSSSENPL